MPPDALRARFAQALQAMYRAEVHSYARLHELVVALNEELLRERGDERADNSAAVALLSAPVHGAIRVGSARELSWLGRLFALFGMLPVDFYDLVPAGLPVMSTAFRPVGERSLAASPFRMFCSLLRTELIAEETARETVESSLAARDIFPSELKAMIEVTEATGSVAQEQADDFVGLAVDVFRWRGEARISQPAYNALLDEHRLIADIAAFPGPHINHLTPACLDIDRLQAAMFAQGFNAKARVEGPPRRACPILLRQTACKAEPETVRFPDSAKPGAHTARFGEVEQRGAALTGAGRRLYDRCLDQARAAAGSGEAAYGDALDSAFETFPDNRIALVEDDLAWFRFSATARGGLHDYDLTSPSGRAAALRAGALEASPLLYEDFLPVSAAGIFRSNLGDAGDAGDAGDESYEHSSNRGAFEEALGRDLLSPMALYQAEQEASLAALQTADQETTSRPR